MPDRIVLDHVAHAAEHHRLLLPRYAEELGAGYVGHGASVGFSPLQVRFANDAKVELLRPHDEDSNPFLRRFLDRRGPGLHHATFKVPDIRATMAALEGAGFRVVDIDLSYPDWQEAFVHPKTAYGFLVQIAQATGTMPGERPDWFPASTAVPADLVRLVLAVASLDGALRLYRDQLGGAVDASGDDEGRWVDLDHDGGQLVRLWEPADPSVLGGAPGRADHLALRVDDPSSVTDAVAVRAGEWEVPAAANHGVRLVLVPRA